MSLQSPTMRQQPPAQAVIQELLRQHSSTPARSRLARFFGSSPLGADSISWYAGAKGEIAVGRILATLPAEWTAFHALPIGDKGADIDHIVIGPGGVFTINTKHHGGKAVWVAGRTLMVSGHKEPHIRNSEFEAGRVTKLLRERMPLLAPVQPVVALVNSKSLTIKTTPEQVKVIADVGLRRWLMRRPPVLTEGELAQLAAIIDDPATWPPPTSPPTDNLGARFAALDAEVRTAHLRSTLWRLLGVVTGTGALVVAWPTLVAALMDVATGGGR